MSGDVAAAGTPLLAQLRAAAAADRRSLLEVHLKQQLGQTLRLPPARLDARRPLGSFGIESLTALEFRRRLEKSLGLKLPATLVWNYPTLAALTDHLAERLELTSPAGQASEVAAPLSPQGGLDALSEEEALRALMQPRARPQ
jgi:acyl carrier protein